MESLLHVDAATATLPGSPTNSFLADEVASTCPLITPSPPTNDLLHPLPETSESTFNIGDVLTSKLNHVKGDDSAAADSASSSSSAIAEPSCTQLLNHRNYHHIIKDESTALQETVGKTHSLQITFRNPPDNYFFMTWNWPLIRKVCVWSFLSGLIAMLALVIAMVSTLPRSCNPSTEWYQGKLMYEIFPASYSDFDGDGIGDLKGLSTNSTTDYLQSLGVRTIRLNSIFPAHDYPENYKNVTSLTDIAPQLGNLKDFGALIKLYHSKNISVLLDMPIWPYVKKLTCKTQIPYDFNSTDFFSNRVDGIVEYDVDVIADAILFWVQQGVDGFFLKGAEHLVENANFGQCLRGWKRIIGPDRVFIVAHDVVKGASNIILNNIDLIDVRLEIERGVVFLRKQIESVQNETLFSKPGMPWVHWSLGDENTIRLANRLPFGNGTLGATMLQLLLPGTPSIFYGDEVGLQQVSDPFEERKDQSHLHQLGAMVWRDPNKMFTRKQYLPWLHGHSTDPNFEQLQLISKAVKLRFESPAIYINSVNKDGTNKANAEVKYSERGLLVIQRWYPRRKSYVIASNMGVGFVSADLSKLLYSGQVVVGPRAHSKSESISFKEVSLWPGESVIILLD